jgi:uncharacterized protein involved in exopolysaccharide biosynthesis
LAAANETLVRNREQFAKLASNEREIKTDLTVMQSSTAEDLAADGILPDKRHRNESLLDEKDSSSTAPDANNGSFSVTSHYAQLKIQLRELENFRIDAKSAAKDDSESSALDTEISRLKNRIAAAMEVIEEGRVARIKTLKTQLSQVEQLIKSCDAERLEAQQSENDLERLVSEEKTYNTTLGALNSQLIAVSRERLDYIWHVVEAGVGNDLPIWPNRYSFMILGAILGAVSGLIAILFGSRPRGPRGPGIASPSDAPPMPAPAH